MNIFRAFECLGPSGRLAAVAISLAAVSTAAFGDAIKVSLNGDAEVPPVATSASGSGTITINPDMTVSGAVTTKGLTATAAHIHIGAKGKNGPVAVGLTKDGDHGWMVPAGAKLTDVQYQAYKAGELYVNVHTAANKGGEIRGQLMP